MQMLKWFLSWETNIGRSVTHNILPSEILQNASIYWSKKGRFKNQLQEQELTRSTSLMFVIPEPSPSPSLLPSSHDLISQYTWEIPQSHRLVWELISGKYGYHTKAHIHCRNLIGINQILSKNFHFNTLTKLIHYTQRDPL